MIQSSLQHWRNWYPICTLVTACVNTSSVETENRGYKGPETGSDHEMDKKALSPRDGPVQLTRFTRIAQ